MSSKAALKAINEAVRQQKFDEAIEKAQEFLKKEPKNHQGYGRSSD
jgi:superkiller protein 3